MPEIEEDDESPDLPVAKPAATLIVFDDSAAGPPRILMVRRSEKMVFAGGAVVFPGGRVDADDMTLARQVADENADSEDLAGRIAAIRETIEETGLLVGVEGHAVSAASRIRAGLHAGEPFASLLESSGLTLDLDALTPFARWNPKLNSERRFDTRFYVARGSATDGMAVDGSENSLLYWASASESLAMAGRGEIKIIFPTRRNLERLAGYASFAEAIECAARNPVSVISPSIEWRGEERWLVIPDGMGYPVTEERMATARRG